MPQKFPKVMSTFGVTPYSPDRDDPEKNRQLYEHYQDQVSTQPLPEDTLPWNVPFPPGQFAQAEFDDMLQRRIVDPLAQAGMEDLGAGLAAVPSAAHSMVVPQTEFDVAGTIIPLPGVAKLMKKGKFRKIRNAMKAEDPENVGEIIAKQAGKIPEKTIYQERGFGPTGIEIEDWIAKISKLQGDEQKKSVKELLNSIDDEAQSRYVKNNLAARRIPIDNAKAEVRAIDEKEMFRKADEMNAREKTIDKQLREGTQANDDWTKIDPKKYYDLDGNIMSGQELKDELLQMSTGDFHMAKWREVEKPLEKDKWSKILREDEEIDAEKNQQAIDEARKRIEDRTNKPKLVDSPKPPKGDPEASRTQFPGIRSQLDIAPSRTNERGEAFGDVGQSEFRPYEQPMPASLEPIQKRNYVERELDPVQQTITKVLADPAMAELTPEQKQALADFVRYRHKVNADMTKDYAFDASRNIKDYPESIQGVTGKSRDLYDRNIYRAENQLDPYWNDDGWEAYQKLDKAFGPDQAIIRYRHPAVKKMFDTLSEDVPFGRSDTSFDESRDLQTKMYKGRPSHEAEQEKFGKIKEAMKEAPKAKSKPEKYVIRGMMGENMGFGKFKSEESAQRAITKMLNEKGYDSDEIENLMHEYIIEKAED